MGLIRENWIGFCIGAAYGFIGFFLGLAFAFCSAIHSALCNYQLVLLPFFLSVVIGAPIYFFFQKFVYGYAALVLVLLANTFLFGILGVHIQKLFMRYTGLDGYARRKSRKK